MDPPYNDSLYNNDTTYKKQVDSIFNVLQHKTLMWREQNCYDYNPDLVTIPDSIRKARLKASHYETVMWKDRNFNYFKDNSISPIKYKDTMNFGVLFNIEMMNILVSMSLPMQAICLTTAIGGVRFG